MQFAQRLLNFIAEIRFCGWKTAQVFLLEVQGINEIRDATRDGGTHKF